MAYEKSPNNYSSLATVSMTGAEEAVSHGKEPSVIVTTTRERVFAATPQGEITQLVGKNAAAAKTQVDSSVGAAFFSPGTEIFNPTDATSCTAGDSAGTSRTIKAAGPQQDALVAVLAQKMATETRGPVTCEKASTGLFQTMLGTGKDILGAGKKIFNPKP